jgi:hypothetical protein
VNPGYRSGSGTGYGSTVLMNKNGKKPAENFILIFPSKFATFFYP